MRSSLTRFTPLIVALVLGSAPSARAQEAAAPAFSAQQLETMVAPIALYPDSLVSQLLMAATYPLEIVEAARWAAKNGGAKGADLEAALKDQDWDPSVKSLCGFPDLLKRMNENLDWTTDLGDAFLDQKTDVMDAIQRMRGKAYESGKLESSKEQTVTQQPDKIIVIESADPEVVYVPTYSSTVVYGAPPAPYYPAMYAPPGYGALAFTAGVAWGAAMWGDCNWGWGSSNVDIDVNNYNNFNKNTNVNAERYNKTGSSSQWSHDPAHRSGANYRSSQTAQKYGAQPGQTRTTQAQARGYSQGGARTGSTAQRPAPSASGSRPSAGTTASRGSAGASRPSAGSSSSAFSGSRSGASLDRSASSRGASSRGSYGGGGASRGGGGASRGGGGGGGRR